MTLRHLKTALAAYAILAIAAGFVIGGDLRIRLILWILFAGLAVKSLAAYKLQHDSREAPPTDHAPQSEEES